MSSAVWRKSSRSDSGTSAQCVEVAELAGCAEGNPREVIPVVVPERG
jgi:hypothetical protein